MPNTAAPSSPNQAGTAPTTTLSDKERLSYLVDLYKLYHGHINTMFNYFLILSGLILNAYIQAIQKPQDVNPEVSAMIAIFGAIVSLISLLIHVRSRDMIDTIERGLAQEECYMFQSGCGFFTAGVTTGKWYHRHKYQFPMMYWLFVIGFLLLAVYAASDDIREISSHVGKVLYNIGEAASRIGQKH